MFDAMTADGPVWSFLRRRACWPVASELTYRERALHGERQTFIEKVSHLFID